MPLAQPLVKINGMTDMSGPLVRSPDTLAEDSDTSLHRTAAGRAGTKISEYPYPGVPRETDE